jgi:two-component system, cell cycle sensor histidine kinase and response regulator CckA
VTVAKARILVVEDDNIIVMELEDRLQRLGYTVCAATASGEEAIEAAAEMRPDLVLMDIRLKGAMDGIEAAAAIRARFDIPTVYVTAYADGDTLQRAKITEPYGYVIKPFEEREIHIAVEMALYKHAMERKLKESEQWLAATLRSIGDAVIATDEMGLISLMNPVAEALTGWQRRDALGKRITAIIKLLQEESRILAGDPVVKALEEGRGVDLAKCLLVSRDGKEIPIDGSTALIRDHRGNVVGTVLVFRDVSARKREEQERDRLQAQLFQAQKMEALGVLAGGIAHDFNNLMMTIIGYSSLMLADLGDQEPLRNRIDLIKKAGERAVSLTQQILALSRKEVPQPEVLDLEVIVVDMEDMLQRLIGEDIELVNRFEPGYSFVEADPARIEQVIMNLVLNAEEAMPEGGKLTIETETVSLDEDQCQRMPDAHPGTFVRLSVTDTGVGMDEETLQRIFEPFFSTKQKATGLGLSIAHSIVRQHDGWIDVDSEIGRGSTFRVYLPAVSSDEKPEPAEKPLMPEPQGHGERILLVEDEAGVRAAVQEMLQAGGYEVFAVERAEQAVRAFEREEGNFHLVFSDVVLPDRDGLQLVDELLSRKPDLAVLLSSGYTDQRSQWVTICERGFHFLQKPYGLSDLLPVVREAIEGGRKKRVRRSHLVRRSK